MIEPVGLPEGWYRISGTSKPAPGETIDSRNEVNSPIGTANGTYAYFIRVTDRDTGQVLFEKPASYRIFVDRTAPGSASIQGVSNVSRYSGKLLGSHFKTVVSASDDRMIAKLELVLKDASGAETLEATWKWQKGLPTQAVITGMTIKWVHLRLKKGTYRLVLRAYDDFGNRTESAPFVLYR